MAYIKPIEISFLGPTGVGKSSVLAAMADTIQKATDAAGVRLEFQAETYPRLEKTKVALIERCYRPNMAAKPTLGNVVYELELVPTVLFGVPGAGVPLRITDYPGEWLTGTPEQVREVKATIQSCSIVMIAIDAVGLMESENPEIAYVNQSNQSEQVINVLRETIRATDKEPKLLIFVPIRVEKWLNAAGDKVLLDRFKEVYKASIDLFNSSKYSQNVSMVFIPVSTIGIVEYFKLGPRRSTTELPTDGSGNEKFPEGRPTPFDFEFYYRRIGDKTVMEPKYADELLRYALAFSMVLFKNRSKDAIEAEVERGKAEVLEFLTGDDPPAWWNAIVNTLGKAIAYGTGEAAKSISNIVVNWPANTAIRGFVSSRRDTLPISVLQSGKLPSKEEPAT